MTRTVRPWRGTGIRPLDDLYKEMDGIVQHFFGEEPPAGSTRGIVPRINLAETESGYEISVDLPGLKPEDVSVEMHDDQLTISGHRAAEQEEHGKTFHRVERRHGEFRRVVKVPVPVDEAKISADYSHGVLTVILPKIEKPRPTRIEVKTSGR